MTADGSASCRRSEPPRITVAYVMSLFPKLSETFILNEVLQLQSEGIDVVPISCDWSRKLEAKQHASASELARPVAYVMDHFPLGHGRALLHLVRRHPARLLRMIARCLRHPAPRGESRVGRCLAAIYVAALAEQLQVDRLHAHWSYPGDIAICVAQMLELPVSFTAHAHDIFEDIPLYEAAGYPFAKRVAAADFVVTCTAANLDAVKAHLPAELWPRLHHAYHGLDLDMFRPPEPRRPCGERFTFMSVGRFVPYKGFDVIVSACGELARRGREFECWLAGPQGSQSEIVRQQIAAAGLTDSVLLLGPQSQEELAVRYRECDAYVNASDPAGEYGVANVIIEALASGLPTVATRRPQVSEYITDGVDGILLPYGDATALADTLEQLMNDETLRARLSSRGRELAEARFDVAATGRRITSLLSTAAAA